MDQSIGSKVKNATKWSVITEIAAKLISPFSNMVLARLLTPEAFGVVATVTMITSFADMFTDAGFQKYLIQHEFSDDDDRRKSTTVAFWTNLAISLLLWIIIGVNKDWIANIVGNPGLGDVILIACFSLPLTSFSSIQMALFKRDFDFKTLFFVRLISIAVPIVVTIPLAFITHSYWALIIGTITMNFVNAVVLTIKSDWKPNLYFSLNKLREMLSFSCWTLVEQISIWLTSYIGTFIVGTFLTTYYVGLYKTSMTNVNQIIALITSATTPVLFSALSRVQDDNEVFEDIFYKFQRGVGLFVFPIGAGIYLYRALVTRILLGSQWGEAASFIGLWGFMSSLTIVFSHYSSEVYRAKGKPRLSFFVQCAHLIFLVPALTISGKYGFEALYFTRSLARIQMILINLVVMWAIFKITPAKQILNVLPEMIATIGMVGVSLLLKQIGNSILWEFISIFICAVSYFAIIMLFKRERQELFGIIWPYIDKAKKTIQKNSRGC